MPTNEKDDQPSVEATVFEEAPDETFEPNEPTRIHNRSEASNQNAVHMTLKDEEPDTKGDDEVEQEEFQWDAPSGLSHRVSPKSYYSDESVFSKLFNVFSLIMMVIGLVGGFIGGYMIRGFFVEVETPQANVSPNHESLMHEPSVATPPAAVAAAPATAATNMNENLTATPENATPTAPTVPETAAAVEEPPAKLTPPPKNSAVFKPTPKAAPAKPATKTIKQIKILTFNNQVIVDVTIAAPSFKYSARPSPSRLTLDIDGIGNTNTKNSIAAAANAKPLANITVSKRSPASMRLVFNLKSKGSPKYTVNRTKGGLKVVFRK